MLKSAPWRHAITYTHSFLNVIMVGPFDGIPWKYCQLNVNGQEWATYLLKLQGP